MSFHKDLRTARRLDPLCFERRLDFPRSLPLKNPSTNSLPVSTDPSIKLSIEPHIAGLYVRNPGEVEVGVRQGRLLVGRCLGILPQVHLHAALAARLAVSSGFFCWKRAVCEGVEFARLCGHKGAQLHTRGNIK